MWLQTGDGKNALLSDHRINFFLLWTAECLFWRRYSHGNRQIKTEFKPHLWTHTHTPLSCYQYNDTERHCVCSCRILVFDEYCFFSAWVWVGLNFSLELSQICCEEIGQFMVIITYKLINFYSILYTVKIYEFIHIHSWTLNFVSHYSVFLYSSYVHIHKMIKNLNSFYMVEGWIRCSWVVGIVWHWLFD